MKTTHPTVAIYHDTRRKKTSNTFPVKLRVYDPRTRKKKLYPAGMDLTKKDFAAAWPAQPGARNYEARKIHNRLAEALAAADAAVQAATKNGVFGFAAFEDKMAGGNGKDESLLPYWLEARRANFLQVGGLSSAEAVGGCIRHLNGFLGDEYDQFPMDGFTAKHLHGWLAYMKEQGLSESTRLRHAATLRTTYNHAFRMEAPITHDPFRYARLELAYTRRHGDHLTVEQLQKLLDADFAHKPLRRARALWLLAFFTNGCYLSDLAAIDIQSFSEDSFTFRRVKMRHSKHGKNIRVHVLPEMLELAIECRDFVGCALGKDRAEGRKLVQDETSRVTQQLKRIAKRLDLPEGFSMRWARHTHATLMRDAGISTHDIAESVGHQSSRVTEAVYIGAQKSERARANAEILKTFIKK